SGIVTAGFGLLRASGGGYEVKAVELHRWFGLAIPLGTLITLAAQRWACRAPGAAATLGYRAALACTLALLVLGGHLGGNLTHGSGYLIENAPAFVRDLLESPSVRAHPAAALNDQERFYAEKVAPVFKTRCYH